MAYKTTAAKTAAMIRKQLRKSGIKASVTSDTYSMGNSVRVKLKADYPPETIDAITEYVDQFQQGHFDGMNDMYEYSRCRDDIPQVKYTFVEHRYSEQFVETFFNLIRTSYKGLQDIQGTYKENENSYPKDLGECLAFFVHRLLRDKHCQEARQMFRSLKTRAKVAAQ